MYNVLYNVNVFMRCWTPDLFVLFPNSKSFRVLVDSKERRERNTHRGTAAPHAAVDFGKPLLVPGGSGPHFGCVGHPGRPISVGITVFGSKNLKTKQKSQKHT